MEIFAKRKKREVEKTTVAGIPVKRKVKKITEDTIFGIANPFSKPEIKEYTTYLPPVNGKRNPILAGLLTLFGALTSHLLDNKNNQDTKLRIRK